MFGQNQVQVVPKDKDQLTRYLGIWINQKLISPRVFCETMNNKKLFKKQFLFQNWNIQYI